MESHPNAIAIILAFTEIEMLVSMRVRYQKTDRHGSLIGFRIMFSSELKSFHFEVTKTELTLFA